jgi:hypothetical protein
LWNRTLSACPSQSPIAAAHQTLAAKISKYQLFSSSGYRPEQVISEYQLRPPRRMPSRSTPQNAIATSAQVAIASKTTIASSMTESTPLFRRACIWGGILSPDQNGWPWDETIFLSHEATLKQKAGHPVVNKTGMAAMQFIFDLIWNQSRSKYLIAIAEQEGES